jgi:hypothetical protein
MKEKIIGVLIQGLLILLNAISPDLKEFISKSLAEWEIKAKATKNPFDDLLVKLLIVIFQ